MDYKPTSTRRAPRHRAAGFALTEAMIAIGLTGILLATLVSITVMSGRSFAALGNYVELDDKNRIAMDTLTRDIRQANRVISSTTNNLTLEDFDGFNLIYNYNSEARTFSRIKAGVSSILLRDCDSLSFSMSQRNPIGGTYDVYPTATAGNCKMVNITWVCSKTIFGIRQNTENVQTARIVIRKQGT